MTGSGGDPSADEALGLRPLTARSVLLSLLLGSHPPALPVSVLVRLGEMHGIAQGTARVALSRMVAEGDLVAEEGTYRLSERLLDRQRLQDEGREPPLKEWSGAWEIAIAKGASGRALASAMAELRLAEWLDGVWLRPDNLSRPWPSQVPDPGVIRFAGRREDDAGELAARCWDLEAWSTRGNGLLEAMENANGPARRFVVAAAALRHLRTDPLLPAALLPPSWPGRRLRDCYAGFESEIRAMLRTDSRGPDDSARHRAG